MVAAAPTSHDTSTARIWFVGLGCGANSNSQLTRRINRRLGCVLSNRPIGKLRSQRKKGGTGHDHD